MYVILPRFSDGPDKEKETRTILFRYHILNGLRRWRDDCDDNLNDGKNSIMDGDLNELNEQLDSLIRSQNCSVACCYGIIKSAEYLAGGLANMLKRTIHHVARSKKVSIMKVFYESVEWAGGRDDIWYGLLAESIARCTSPQKVLGGVSSAAADGTSEPSEQQSPPRRPPSPYFTLALEHFYRALHRYLNNGLLHTHPLCVAASMGVARCGRLWDARGCELLLKQLCVAQALPPGRSAQNNGDASEAGKVEGKAEKLSTIFDQPMSPTPIDRPKSSAAALDAAPGHQEESGASNIHRKSSCLGNPEVALQPKIVGEPLQDILAVRLYWYAVVVVENLYLSAGKKKELRGDSSAAAQKPAGRSGMFGRVLRKRSIKNAKKELKNSASNDIFRSQSCLSGEEVLKDSASNRDNLPDCDDTACASNSDTLATYVTAMTSMSADDQSSQSEQVPQPQDAAAAEAAGSKLRELVRAFSLLVGARELCSYKNRKVRGKLNKDIALLKKIMESEEDGEGHSIIGTGHRLYVS